MSETPLPKQPINQPSGAFDRMCAENAICGHADPMHFAADLDIDDGFLRE